MALNIVVATATVPTVDGNFDVTLPADTDPKAVIAVVTPQAANGLVSHGSFGVGLGTYRSAAVQHGYTAIFNEDAIGTSDTYRAMGSGALVKLMDAAGAVDLEIDLVSMTTGAGSKITLNAVNRHTTASVRIWLMVFGGDDVVDAEKHEVVLTTGAGAQDVTLSSGFGHPDVVFFTRVANTAADGATGADIGIGFGIREGDDRSVWWGAQDAAANAASFSRSDNDSALIAGANGTIETDIALGAESGWPTDGYEISKTTSSFASEQTQALAIRFSGDVTITSGQGTARTSVGDTDLAVGTSTPKGLILLHDENTAANSTLTTGAGCAHLGVGFVDGSGNERWAGTMDDDVLTTMDTASAQVDDKAIRYYNESGQTLVGEADCTVSGSNFRLSWGDPTAVAYLYQWIAFGEAAAAGASAKKLSALGVG
jgi:hypothetical protein